MATKKTAKKVIRLKKKYAILTIMLLALTIFVVVVGTSYAFFTSRTVSKEVVVYTGTLKVEFKNNGNGINLTGTKPMTNAEGLSTAGYDFNIKNTGSIKARYQIRLELLEDNEIPIEYIKLSYMKTKEANNVTDNPDSDPILLSSLNDSLVFISDEKIDATNEDSYKLKLWLDISTPNDMQGKTFKARIVVDSIQDIDAGYVFTSIPVINLKKDDSGNINTVLKLNDTYTDPGVESIKDDKDTLNISNVTTSIEYYNGSTINTVNSIDTSVTGVYYITYSITDSDNKTGHAIRIVTVNNTEQTPTITLRGNNPYNIAQDSIYTDPGVNVENGNKVVAIGEVKTSAIGPYTVRYIVIDQYGNMNSITRTVNVLSATILRESILANNTLITTAPTLNTSSNNTSDASGLYKMSVTNGYGGTDGDTYYFRGNVTNNYVSFASKIWRIVRINEDGTIRLILDGDMDGANHAFNPASNDYTYMYYSNSTAKNEVDAWYGTNITGTDATKVATGNYFCEAAKNKADSALTSGSATMTVYSSYTPNLKCDTDGNNKGLLNNTIGLITYDEIVLAGGYFSQSNSDYYLYKNAYYWTMSPAGYHSYGAYVWCANPTGGFNYRVAYYEHILRPVINLVSTVQATGTGTSADPYVIQ